MNKLKIVFLGTPDFAVPPLKSLISNTSVEILAVCCNHDKPVGRKQILTPPPVKQVALDNGIKVLQYKKIREEGFCDIKALAPDLIITCAFGQILSQEIIDIPKYGVFNIHGSLLPKYRGASPIQTSILCGETTTGITIMKTDIGIDTGDIIYQKSIDILPSETAGELFDRLSVLGAECITKVIEDLLSNKITFTKQNENMASVTKMIKKEQGLIDFNLTSQEIVNKIRAFNPSPIAYFILDGVPVKIYSAKSVSVKESYENGRVLKADSELLIKTADGAISIQELQKSGGKRLKIKEFLLGNKLTVGTVI